MVTSPRLRGASRLVFTLAGLVVAGLVLWKLTNLLLILFGALLVALVLSAIANLITGHTRLSHGPAVAAAVLLVFACLIGFSLLLGLQIVTELSQLASRLPDLSDAVASRFNIDEPEKWLFERLRSVMGSGSLLSDLTGVSAFVTAAFVNTVVIVAGGIYFAVRPDTYSEGLLRLFPRDRRQQVAETLALATVALRHWMVGQLLSMLCVGALVTLGLFAIGVPSAMALGFLAGVLEFIPYVGPVLSLVPAVAVGLAEGPATAAWVVGLFFVVQQVEAALITPLVQRKAVDLPPAVTLFAILAFGVLFGPWGVVFGAPLTVFTFVVVKKIWIRDTLGEPTPMPGD